ncbi:MAG: helix-turn-helix domain-containing protein [Bacteroidota bacterium]
MATATKTSKITHTECTQATMAVKDALDVLSGRWKLPIIVSLKFGIKRFKEISKEVTGISDKVLAKELKDLEINQLIKRTVYDTFPPTVEYSITEHGKSLFTVIDELKKWGVLHRKKIIGK